MHTSRAPSINLPLFLPGGRVLARQQRSAPAHAAAYHTCATSTVGPRCSSRCAPTNMSSHSCRSRMSAYTFSTSCAHGPVSACVPRVERTHHDRGVESDHRLVQAVLGLRVDAVRHIGLGALHEALPLDVGALHDGVHLCARAHTHATPSPHSDGKRERHTRIPAPRPPATAPRSAAARR